MIRTILLLVFGGFVLASPVSAVSVTISNTPLSITDEPFNIDASVTGAQAGTNYLRANLFPTGTTKYFGYTNNGTSFVNTSDYSQYFPIPIDSSGNWSGSIEAKVDTDSSYYMGPGTYSLKARRYTKSGSSYTWSNEVTLSISLPIPSPTPTPTPIPTPTPSPTATPTSTSASKKATGQSTTSTSTPTPTPKSSLPPNSNKEDGLLQKKISTKTDSLTTSIAGITATATPSASPSIEVKGQRWTNYISWVGILMVVSGVGLFAYVYLRSKNLHETISHLFRKRN